MSTKDPSKAAGYRIRKCREEQGLSQENLAADVGVSVQTISSAERGIRTLNPKNLMAVAKKLNVTVDYIISGDKIEKDYLLYSSRIRNLTPEHQKLVEAILSALEETEKKQE